MTIDIPADLVGVVIRTCQYPLEFECVRKLWEGAGDGIHLRRSDERAEIEKKLQRDPELFLVAERSGEIIGTVLGGFDGRRGLVYHLAVAAPYRGKGIARRLMAELESRLRVLGCIRCYLLATRDNQPAIQFYEKEGWEIMDLLAYAKDLD